MDFRVYLQANAGKIDEAVDQTLSEWFEGIKKEYPKLIPLSLAFINACKGGKRIRGTLVKLGYEIANQSSVVSLQSSDIIRVGAALEILHASILAHDDIIDKSELRRGQKTLYQVLGGDHYGVSQAIGLADIGFFLCLSIISKSKFQDQEKNQAIGIVSKMMMDTGLGEILDVELPHLGGERKEEDVIKIMHLKTAQYTISGPLMIGAILGGAEESLMDALGEYGDNLGIAFQIQDDILGVFGEEKELGKSVTSDIEEGKNTLLITEALKRVNQEQKEVLAKYYGQGKIDDKKLEQIRQVFTDTGSLDYSKAKAVKYVKAAKAVIPEITQDKDLDKLLTEMASFLVERRS
ncbi:MAG: polyprenyl synthetase family protein [Candidatus Daviesbacteria bacterium]|nr:polyprenyl synthetase family protein [Candidatus Daviesbacteria bacterium]